VIKEYFANYYLHHTDITFNFAIGNMSQVHKNVAEPWRVTVVDTGLNTMTGGRIKRIEKYVGAETFMMTYGDGVSDIDLRALLANHQHHGKAATLSAVQPAGRFGVLDIAGDDVTVRGFREKAQTDAGWINAGFMVLEPEVFDYIDGDDTFFEHEPLERLSHDGKLGVYKHTGFWQCMDTQRDKIILEKLWEDGKAPWKVW
jgi:glucose-1-phosphate cytidylyltransferase